ncbi:hypothetical protein [Novosphingobium sp.]|uniref:hypothetical protein n=1 Tax=Novosphingobium sp. TaxID=1874826 RepID=UPI0035AF92C5
MQEFLYFALLIFTFVVWPIWLFRRMRKVREMTSGVDRDVAERRSAMPWEPYTDAVQGEDGLTYSRAMEVTADQISAESRAAEMPDINQTLQGKK